MAAGAIAAPGQSTAAALANSLQLILPVLIWLIPFTSGGGSGGSENRYEACAETSMACGDNTVQIRFPFLVSGRPDFCGHPFFNLSCNARNTSAATTAVGIHGSGSAYDVEFINYSSRVIGVSPEVEIAAGGPCPHPPFSPSNPLLVFPGVLDSNLTLYIRCKSVPSLEHLAVNCISGGGGGDEGEGNRAYFLAPEIDARDAAAALLQGICGVPPVEIPVYGSNVDASGGDGAAGFYSAVNGGFAAKWTVGYVWCDVCERSGGICGSDPGDPAARICFCPGGGGQASPSGVCDDGKDTTAVVIIVASLGGATVLTVIGCCFVFCFHLYRRRREGGGGPFSTLFGKKGRRSSNPSSASENPSTHNLTTNIFSYEELCAATNGFHESNELGDGGFGAVYGGKLKDGRAVAVKRLYENNCRQMEQFMNEVAILSRLRHPNLVTLYGCTSSRSRELLLVYELVPNGTLADHLHGRLRRRPTALPWPLRLCIASEIAAALAYLHAVDPPIVHRDIKTSNILLGAGFGVKVADFGLSRPFPGGGATHVSTAPQGTPGYVDPEYHHCYQLTDRSDVYSFGVVLAELISSMPAVDVCRRRHEINLAAMAVDRIQRRELDILVDPELGFGGDDEEVGRPITMVAELAFRCLQGERCSRPSIKEVLESLMAIRRSCGMSPEAAAEDGDAAGAGFSSANVGGDDSRLLKSPSPLCSPDSVMDKWGSKTTTPHSSV